MFEFLKNMYVQGRVTKERVQNAVIKGFITQEQADAIIGA